MDTADQVTKGDKAPLETVVMCHCGKNPASDPHSCPYAYEIGDDDNPEYCTCCSDCESNCVLDI